MGSREKSREVGQEPEPRLTNREAWQPSSARWDLIFLPKWLMETVIVSPQLGNVET